MRLRKPEEYTDRGGRRAATIRGRDHPLAREWNATPRRFRAASRSTSRAHRYPGAAPRSRPGASASGPLQLSASVCGLITLIYLSYTLPLNLQNYAAKGRRRFASAGAGSARGRLRRVRVCCL